ncbi:MAG: DUF47 family protein [Methanobacteriota archaeon]
MNEKALSSWFRKRRESTVLDTAREHLLKILDSARDMDTAMMHVEGGEKAEALKDIQRVILAEKAADNIELRMHETLATGDLPSKEREDLMHLVKRQDHISDWIKSAAMNLEILIESNVKIPPEMWGKYRVITLKAVSAVTALKGLMDSLGVNNQDIGRYAADVDRLEHEVDDDYFAIKKDLMLSDIDPRVISVMRDLLYALENALDNVKSSSELVHIIITSAQ